MSKRPKAKEGSGYALATRFAPSLGVMKTNAMGLLAFAAAFEAPISH